MTKWIWWVALAVTACAGRPTTTVAPASPDDAVWGAALADFERQDTTVKVIVVDAVVSDSGSGGDSATDPLMNAILGRIVSPAVRAAWNSANSRPRKITQPPTVPGHPARIGTDSDSASSTAAFPYFKVTAPGYSRGGDTALVGLMKFCGDDCFGFMLYRLTRNSKSAWTATRAFGTTGIDVKAELKDQDVVGPLSGVVYSLVYPKGYSVGSGVWHGDSAILVTVSDPAMAMQDSATQEGPARDLAAQVAPAVRRYPKFKYIVIGWSAEVSGPILGARIHHKFLISSLPEKAPVRSTGGRSEMAPHRS